VTASPAQVANDLTAQAVYFARRDAHVERACRDAARMIRRHLAGEPVDGRSWGSLPRWINTYNALRDRRGGAYAHHYRKACDALAEFAAGLNAQNKEPNP
jgi:hypothetical protein